MPSIAVIGSLNIDFITTTARVPNAGETLTATSSATGYGGKGANQAVACARLSRPKPPNDCVPADNDDDDNARHVKTSMVGAVGGDSFGDEFVAALAAQGVGTAHVRRERDQRTGIANIIVEEASGENRILVVPNANHFDGVVARGAGSGAWDLVPGEADVVVFQLEIPLSLVIHNIELARSQGKYVVLNPAPAQKLPDELYKSIDCLVMNESETDLLRDATTPLSADDLKGVEEVAGTFVARGVRDLVVITLGGNGVYYSARSQSGSQGIRSTGHVPGRKVKVVDTTAAGDTFVGALAVQIAINGGKTPEHPESIIDFANRAAAKTVEKAGAQAAIPWLDEVDPA